MRVFLTGGTGLLGSHLAEGLRAAGHEVRALVRPGAEAGHLVSLGCDLVAGDARDDADTQARRMEGCGGLVHAAAFIYGAPSLDAARAVNVHGTERVLEGAARAGVERVVHVSSVAVYGTLPGPITEETPLLQPLPPWDYYGQTKREAEAVAAGFHGRGGMQITVLRPPALMGERDRLFVPRLVRWLRRPVVFLPGSGRSRLAVVYAGNLTQVVARILEGVGGGEVFNVTRDVDVTLRTLCEGFSRELGLKPRFVDLPAGLVRQGAAWGEGLGIRVPGARDLPLTRVARLALEDNPYPAEKAHRMLGWRPSFSLEEALERMGRWLRHHETSERGRRHGRR